MMDARTSYRGAMSVTLHDTSKSDSPMDHGEPARSSSTGEAVGTSAFHPEITSALLDAVISQMRDGILVQTSDYIVLVINPACCKLFSITTPPTSLRGTRTRDLSPALAELIDAALAAGGTINTLDGRIQKLKLPSGTAVECCCRPVGAESESAVHVWQFQDATERREREEEVEDSRKRLRELTAHLEDVREEERRSLAQALHDEVGQTLTGVRLELAGAIEQLRHATAGPTTDAIDRLQAAVGLVDLSLDIVRRVSRALRPPLLDQFGLVPAVKWEAAVFEQRTRIRARVQATPNRIGLPPSHVTALYRILLEALTNVTRHAHASAVDIRLRVDGNQVVMEVRDNGRGIVDVDISKMRTMGLLGMRERALNVGGDVRISAARDGGTVVVVTLPFDGAEAGTPA